MRNLEIFKLFRDPKKVFIFLGVSLVLFDIGYYLLGRLPGARNLQCVPGAWLTTGNLAYLGMLILLSVLSLFNLGRLFRMNKRSVISGGGISGIGILFGGLSAFCTLCTLPVISLFGIGIGVGFLTTYNLFFKILSLSAMVLGLYFLNKRLAHQCEICKA